MAPTPAKKPAAWRELPAPVAGGAQDAEGAMAPVVAAAAPEDQPAEPEGYGAAGLDAADEADQVAGVVADATDPQPEAEELTTAEADDAAHEPDA